MKIRSMVALTVLGLAAAACSGEAKQGGSGSDGATAKKPDAPAPVDSPEPVEAPRPAETPAKAEVPNEGTADETAEEAAAPKDPWHVYTAVLPFVIGSKDGLAAAKEAGRPAMLFYTATW